VVWPSLASAPSRNASTTISEDAASSCQPAATGGAVDGTRTGSEVGEGTGERQPPSDTASSTMPRVAILASRRDGRAACSAPALDCGQRPSTGRSGEHSMRFHLLPASLASALALATLLLAACGSPGQPATQATVTAPAAAGAAGPRLYVLDCGTIAPMDPALYNFKAEELSRGETSFVSPCFLVVHPEGHAGVRRRPGTGCRHPG
jgi:hypothetical protein